MRTSSRVTGTFRPVVFPAPAELPAKRQSSPALPPLQLQSDMPPLPADDVEPAGHGTQESARTAAKESGGQEEHVTAAVPEEIPVNAHGWHADDPLADLKKPAAQGLHGPPSGPVNPALHVQFDTLSLRASESESSGQLAHVAPADRFAYDPAGQGTVAVDKGEEVVKVEADEEVVGSRMDEEEDASVVGGSDAVEDEVEGSTNGLDVEVVVGGSALGNEAVEWLVAVVEETSEDVVVGSAVVEETNEDVVVGSVVVVDAPCV
eukprot:918876-Rhodomonas_salina.1